jgi:hypothetical protein
MEDALIRVAKPIDAPDRFGPGRKGLYTPCPRDVRAGPAVWPRSSSRPQVLAFAGVRPTNGNGSLFSRVASTQEREVGGYSMDGVSPGSSRKTRCTTPSSSCRPTWTKPFATTTFLDATLCSAT